MRFPTRKPTMGKTRTRALAASFVLALSGATVPVASVAGAQTPAPTQTTQTMFGVHEFNIGAHSEPDIQPDQTERVKSLGASFVRLPTTWHLMEAGTKGQTPDWFWASLDADIAAAEAAGLEVIVEFGNTPCWASSDPQKDCSGGDDTYLHYQPANPQDYADAFARMVGRYGDRVMAWEVWNEPNLIGNFRSARCGGQGEERGICARPASENDEYDMFVDLESAEEYAELARLATEAALSADPNAKVLVGSIAGGDEQYVQRMYDANLGDGFHALSAHPYTGPDPADFGDNGTSYGPNDCPTTDRNAEFWCFADGVEDLHATMLANGDTRPIWFTEFGFASTDSWNGSGLAGQAVHVAEAVDLIESWEFVPVAAIYQLNDQNNDDREGTFGLFDDWGNMKPAGEAYRGAITAPVDPELPSNGTEIDVLGPWGQLNEDFPTYEWRPVAGAVSYRLWVNSYGGSQGDVAGLINEVYTPAEAGCDDSDFCGVQPAQIVWPQGEYWITAVFADGSSIESQGAVIHR